MERCLVNKSKSSQEVVDEYEKLFEQNKTIIPHIPRNTFIVNLSKISSQHGTRINCPGRKQGYYLEQLVQSLEKIENKIE